jgi:hypothetical protein
MPQPAPPIGHRFTPVPWRLFQHYRPEGDVKAPRCRLGTQRGAALCGGAAGTGFTTP